MGIENIKLLYDYEAERRFLGACCLDSSIIKNFLHWNKFVFHNKLHQIIREIIKNLDIHGGESIDSGMLISQVNIKTEDFTNKEIEELILSVLTSNNYNIDAKTILKYYKLRQLDKSCRYLKTEIKNRIEFEDIEKTILSMLQINREGTIIKDDLGEVLDEVLDDSYIPTKFLTHFKELDITTGGFKPGQLIIVGARPGMGKTSFMLNIAVNQALQGTKTMLISLEMSNRELALRMFAILTEINYRKIEQKNFTKEDIDSLKEAKTILKKSNITLIDKAFGINNIILAIRDKFNRDGLDVVYIDYLQLLSISGHNSNLNAEIGAFTRQLKLLAKELGIAIILGSQLNRQVESRINKRPLLSDLRDSGSIEQDADLVILLFREAYYEKELVGIEAKTLEIDIAKHRNGTTKKIALGFNGPIMKVYDIEQPMGF